MHHAMVSAVGSDHFREFLEGRTAVQSALQALKREREGQGLSVSDVAERSAGLYALLAVNLPERSVLLTDYVLSETQPKLYEQAAACKPADAMERLDVERAKAELD